MGTEGRAALFDRLGGREALFATVRDFYERVQADPTLQPFFEHLDMSKQIDKQVAFLTYAFGGPSRYTGRDLRRAHAPLVAAGLNGAHFDAVAKHLEDTLQDLSVPSDVIEEVMQIVASTRADVLGG